MSSNQDGLFKKEGVGILVPFAMITLCFAMWGFANDVTSPMVKSFGLIFQMSTFESSFVQVAFYLGYFCMALPAALFIRRFSFKAGVVMGLALYALGVLAFVPARSTGTFMAFLPAYFVMTCGLSFLETSCNPYVYAMGSESTGTRRLNFAQAFNPVGALMGAMVALTYVSGSLDPTDGATRRQLLMADPLRFDAIKAHDLDILVQPYLYTGLVILAVLAAVVLTRMPSTDGACDRKGVVSVFVQLLRTKNYREGVVAQFFYVGAQTVCWTYLMHYGHHVFYDLEGLGRGPAAHHPLLLSRLGPVCRGALRLHLAPDARRGGAPAGRAGPGRHRLPGGRNPHRGQGGPVVPRGRVGMHEPDVPHHLWHGPYGRSPSSGVCRGRLGDEHSGRQRRAPAASRHDG